MESFDKKTNPGPYFYHVHQDEKTKQVAVFEFDPIPLADYIASSNKPENPFNKQKLTRVELMRLDRLARWKNPQRSRLNVDHILDGPHEHVDEEMQGLLDHILLQGMQVMEQKQQLASQIQQLFQQDPLQMMEFIDSQVHLLPHDRDQNWLQFMQALTGMAARRFERVNSVARVPAVQDRVQERILEWPRPWITQSQPVIRPSWSSGGN